MHHAHNTVRRCVAETVYRGEALAPGVYSISIATPRLICKICCIHVNELDTLRLRYTHPRIRDSLLPTLEAEHKNRPRLRQEFLVVHNSQKSKDLTVGDEACQRSMTKEIGIIIEVDPGKLSVNL